MNESEGFREVFCERALHEAVSDTEVRASYERLVNRAHSVLDNAQVPTMGRRVWVVPGRIEVLGKHVDYAGGRSLLCCVNRALVMVARMRDDHAIVLRDAERAEEVRISGELREKDTVPWSVYPRTVYNRLASNFGKQHHGVDIALASNLPSAAGVSSSSALTVGLTLVLSAFWNLSSHPEWQANITDRLALAGYVGAIENGNNFGTLIGERGVGTQGGAQDQTGILCCTTNRLDIFRWMPVRHEQSVVWPSEYSFVVAVSGVIAAKTGKARERYNRAARTVQSIVTAWNEQTGSNVRSLREVLESAAGEDRITEVPHELLRILKMSGNSEFSSSHLIARVEQFIDEVFVLVPDTALALAHHNLTAFGSLVDASQAGAERALENQVAETVHLQRIARNLHADAASAFGAGFGGSVWAMIPTHQAEAFLARWRERYIRMHPTAGARSQFFITAPGPAAFELTDRS